MLRGLQHSQDLSNYETKFTLCGSCMWVPGGSRDSDIFKMVEGQFFLSEGKNLQGTIILNGTQK